ncbi:aminoglycoside phosphotransferase family protein [Streptomyces sp. NBC_00820]|uniref:phosphotransferase n=1 Tax=Streptomyces sp. NBC_00820 TaxID=2975842 RepID=UPI002ED2DE1D|nr:aminoglycoside phosphotransferase family protein [Streptomyces sp. NBC_00820]
MSHDAALTVDRGQYPDTVTPWERESWRSAALGWVEDRLAGHGLRATGPLRVRLRPWSVLVRVPVAGREAVSTAGRNTVPVAGRKAVWFKANPPDSRFEGPLTAALARWVPEHVLEPLAVDAGHGWSLLPDGGDLFRDVLERDSVGPGAWEDLLRRYASMQAALVPHAGEIEELGVQRLRTAELASSFDELLAGNPALDADQRARLDALRPRLVDWCAELAALGVPDSLDHADLHEGQLFNPEPGRFTFFDWGDAVVSHPFCSLRVPALQAQERYGDAVLPRLRDAYLEPWTGPGRTAKELRRATSLAWRLGALGRARAWGRVFPGGGGDSSFGGSQSARSLLELCEGPPL